MKGFVCLCGSTRFKDQFEEVNRRLTWSGWIVLSVGSFHHSEKDHDVAGQIIARKIKLDVLHKEKISLAQAIVVINVDGYIGDSTKSELIYARNLGKMVYWFDEFSAIQLANENSVTEESRTLWNKYLDSNWADLLDESPDDLKPV